MVAGVPGQGGATWAVLQYLLGFARLGHDVLFVEQCDGALPGDAPLGTAAPPTSATWRALRARADAAALLSPARQETRRARLRASSRAVARDADLLLNISGMLTDERSARRVPVRAYLDLDPAFNQLWQAQGIDMRFDGHTHFVTVGQAIGTPACPVPTCGLDWIPTAAAGRARALAARRQIGPRRASRRSATGAATARSSTRASTTARRRTRCGELIDAADAHRRALRARARDPPRRDDGPRGARPQRLGAGRPGGWPATPTHYRALHRSGSRAELGIAKSGYVLSRCGWFSDRSACYLASGRPVIAQDTGFSRFLPDRRGPARVRRRGRRARRDRGDPSATTRGHADAARALAEEHLDSDRVLARLLGAARAAHVTSVRTSATELRGALERARCRALRRARDRSPASSAAVRLPDQLRARGARRRARRRRPAAADVQGPQPRAALHEQAPARQARLPATTRCARSRSTATCSRRRARHRRLLRRDRRPGARPLLAVHRERARRRALAGRRARALGGGGPLAGAPARALRAAAPSAGAAPLLRYDADFYGVWIRRARRVRRRAAQRAGAARAQRSEWLAARYDAGRRSGWPLPPTSSTASSTPRTCSSQRWRGAADLPDRLGDRRGRARA